MNRRSAVSSLPTINQPSLFSARLVVSLASAGDFIELKRITNWGW